MAQLALVYLFYVISLSFVVDSIRLGISPMPTPKRALKIVSKIAQLKRVRIAYDFGCGLTSFSSFLPNTIQWVGVEANFWVWFLAKLKQLKQGQLLYCNFTKVLPENGSLIYCYSSRSITSKLEKHLESIAFEGIVVTYFFKLSHKIPKEEIQIGSALCDKLYLYDFS